MPAQSVPLLTSADGPTVRQRYGEATADPAAVVGLRAPSLTSIRSVPLRALIISLIAMAGACTSSLLWPESLINQQILASVLALIPAFLLAYYRNWPVVSVLLAVGIVALCVLHLLSIFMDVSAVRNSPLSLVLAAPYVAIALGAGWFGEIRRAAAQLRTTRLQLIQSEKLESMGRLAAGVAHEVKNPLMTILTGVKILSKRLSDADESTRTLLQDMADAVGRADAIVGGLLSYSRQHELRRLPVDINGTLERSLVLVTHELGKRRIAIVRDFSPALPRLELDESKMEQVFIDLFMNALQAMGEDGILSLRTASTASAVTVNVEDTGPGIPPEHLGKVFDPFFTTKPIGLGTGLGLAVSRHLIDMHGGKIEIGNRDAGGAQVTITLPIGANGEGR